EAKAAKAIAAAKAASMGLTVNPADIAAIESGLVVPMDMGGKKSPSWGLAVAALLVGGAVAFAAAFVMFKKDGTAPQAAAGTAPAVQEPAPPQVAPPAPAPAPAQPTVTPIEEPAAAPAPAPAAAPAAEAAKAQVEVTPI